MPFVPVTRLRVRSWRYLPGFLAQSLGVLVQAKFARGNLSAAVLRDLDLAFWTRTIWFDETTMRAFMPSGMHRRVMPRLLDWCDEAAVVHWLAEPPPWSEAHRRLQADGRTSKVKFPFPLPRTR
ncbi:MAG: DUF3291 domain-containing protein [Xanthobacteraceae bacterium]